MLQALRQMLGTATTALGIVGTEGRLPFRRWRQDLLQLGKAMLLLVIGQSGLDPLTARHLDDLILELRESLDTTVVVITHDIASILAIGFAASATPVAPSRISLLLIWICPSPAPTFTVSSAVPSKSK